VLLTLLILAEFIDFGKKKEPTVAGSFSGYSAVASDSVSSAVASDSVSSVGASHEQGSVLQVSHVLFSSIYLFNNLRLTMTT